MNKAVIQGWALAVAGVAVLELGSAPARAQESTVEQLQELQELRVEVGRRRAELQRELRLLKQVMGEGAVEEMAQFERSLGGMSADEVAAELRMLREELERLRDQVVQTQLGAREERFAVSGQSRTRFEWNDADFVSGDADLVQLMRSRLRVVGRPYIDTRVVVELQDARLWGEETEPSDADGDQVDFHQAYLELEEIYSRPLSLRLGRQELEYAGGRALSPSPWTNRGQAFDALRLRYGGESHVDVVYGKLAETGPHDVRDRNLYGLFGTVVQQAHRVEPFVMVEHDKRSGADRLLRATAGLAAAGSGATPTGHVFGYRVEGAFQTGEAETRDILAWRGAAAVTYSGPSWTRPQVDLGTDWVSGDGNLTDADERAFRAPFATRHRYFGYMDLFGDLASGTLERGLADIYLKGEMSASEEVRLALHLHHFALVEGAQNKLGQEADVTLSYTFNPACTVGWGGMVFVPGDAMKATEGEDPAFKTYLETTVRF